MLMKPGVARPGLLVGLADPDRLKFMDLNGLVGQVLFGCIMEISIVTRTGIGRAIVSRAVNT